MPLRPRAPVGFLIFPSSTKPPAAPGVVDDVVAVATEPRLLLAALEARRRKAGILIAEEVGPFVAKARRDADTFEELLRLSEMRSTTATRPRRGFGASFSLSLRNDDGLITSSPSSSSLSLSEPACVAGIIELSLSSRSEERR